MIQYFRIQILLFVMILFSFSVFAGTQMSGHDSRAGINAPKVDSTDEEVIFLLTKKYRKVIFEKQTQPDFKRLEKDARVKYGQLGNVVVWNEIAFWYYWNYNTSRSAKDIEQWFLLKVKINKLYPDFNSAFTLNNDAWFLFEQVMDTKKLTTALTWSKKAIDMEPHIGNWRDTYANLLYKLGRKEEAIKVQEKALELEPLNENIKNNLNKMRSGK